MLLNFEIKCKNCGSVKCDVSHIVYASNNTINLHISVDCLNCGYIEEVKDGEFKISK
ncbi:MAG: hypothetical protein ACRDD7_03955 [Peptostreptococcaceae bacterium]